MDNSNIQDPQNQNERSPSVEPNTGSLGDTVTGIVNDLEQIVRDEVQLAKSELKEDAGQMAKAGGMVAGAGVFGFTGFVFLMLGVTHLLSKKLEMWLSASIVGSVLVTIAGVLGSMGRSELQGARLAPKQTIESVKENAEWVRQQVSSPSS
jgi:hypothetical protein